MAVIMCFFFLLYSVSLVFSIAVKCFENHPGNYETVSMATVMLAFSLLVGGQLNQC